MRRHVRGVGADQPVGGDDIALAAVDPYGPAGQQSRTGAET
ncbi:hypothetical protein [Streptomyces sp. NPDC000880]